MRHTSLTKVAVIGSLLISVLSGCGSASSNDQGTSVTFLGFFQAFGTSGSTTLPTGLTGAYIQLGDAATEPGTTPTTVGVGPDGSFIGIVGFQNNLSQAGATVNRLELDYAIPGASIQPPSTSIAVTAVMGPPASTTGTTAVDPLDQSSLPAGYRNLPNRSFQQVFLVPPSITAWINLNRAQLPEPPFQMELQATARYTTTSGDVNVTTAQRLTINVLPETFVPPTEGTDGDGTTAADTSEVSTIDDQPSTDGSNETVDTVDDLGTDSSGDDVSTSGDL